MSKKSRKETVREQFFPTITTGPALKVDKIIDHIAKMDIGKKKNASFKTIADNDLKVILQARRDLIKDKYAVEIPTVVYTVSLDNICNFLSDIDKRPLMTSIFDISGARATIVDQLKKAMLNPLMYSFTDLDVYTISIDNIPLRYSLTNYNRINILIIVTPRMIDIYEWAKEIMVNKEFVKVSKTKFYQNDLPYDLQMICQTPIDFTIKWTAMLTMLTAVCTGRKSMIMTIDYRQVRRFVKTITGEKIEESMARKDCYDAYFGGMMRSNRLGVLMCDSIFCVGDDKKSDTMGELLMDIFGIMPVRGDYTDRFHLNADNKIEIKTTPFLDSDNTNISKKFMDWDERENVDSKNIEPSVFIDSNKVDELAKKAAEKPELD